LRGRDFGGNVTNVQYKSNQNCHYESSPYNEYILIKIYKNKLKVVIESNYSVISYFKEVKLHKTHSPQENN
jgi:hypothetical protein